MTANMKFHFKTQINPQTLTEPLWKDRIERWYQLDVASLVMCQAIYEWQKNKINFILPDVIIYEFNKGSNFADHEYAKLTDPSPAKFVYTLPNIPIAAAQQLLKISVPAFCVSNLKIQMNSKLNWLVEHLVKKYTSVLALNLIPPTTDGGQLWTVSAHIYQLCHDHKESSHAES